MKIFEFVKMEEMIKLCKCNWVEHSLRKPTDELLTKFEKEMYKKNWAKAFNGIATAIGSSVQENLSKEV